MYRLALIGLVVAGFAGSLIAVESLAVFADTTSNEDNLFTTGSISISDDPASAVVTDLNMAPGDSVIGALTIENDGTLELRYALTSSSTNDDGKSLRDQLELTVRTEGAGCGAQDGAVLYAGALSGAAFGSPAQGADSGDRVLAAGSDEVLCFRVELPIATGDAFQDAATTATFTFHAEQTANNP
jgi:spore coat-associated protein N